MKCLKFFIILVIFCKTGNVLSDDNIFSVNNIELIKTANINNQKLANQAIKKGYSSLLEKILLEDDAKNLSTLKFQQVRELVSYYQISSKGKSIDNKEKVNFNILFDKDKIHDLFYKKNILYSEISNKELFVLPIFKKENQTFIYNQNFFYKNWNFDKKKESLIEFILPLENIEVIQKFSIYKDDLLSINLEDIFVEYSSANIALVLIEDRKKAEEKIFLKTRVEGKNVDRNIVVKRGNLNDDEFYKRIIFKTRKEITNIIKSQNLIDVRTPSFLNTKLILNKKNSLVELNKRLKNIDLIDNIYVQEFNKNYVLIKIKYLGKLNKIINQLKSQKIMLELLNNKWSLRII